MHRKGQFCGQCEDNYTLPVYSYYLGCVKCEDFRYGWVKFITVIAFFPLTFFYVFMIVLRISATSSTLNSYIFVSQLFATTASLRHIYSFNQTPHIIYKYLLDLVIAMYAVWNLDFFRSFFRSICLHPKITTPQVLILEYAIAVYPLLLILTVMYSDIHCWHKG